MRKSSSRPTQEPEPFRPQEAFARALDTEDTLAPFRARFHLPATKLSKPQIYFCGNSLGLQPKSARAWVDREMDAWAHSAVAAHFKDPAPWYAYHEMLKEPVARLVGAHPFEVVTMNSLTVNLHLMMVSFYRPTSSRYKILIEDCAFPSDSYAVRTHLRHHGLNPADSLIIARPRPGETILRTEDLEALIEERGREIALVLLPGVQYFTGQAFDLARIAVAARRKGCRMGTDLAHAIGNLPLNLHDWEIDFAVWCSYKYLNGGPGTVGGCFIHESHVRNLDLNRFAGWWGNDPQTRFQMHLVPEFVPRPSADGWQVSNPPILAMAPLKASLDLFDEAGMGALREKSKKLTGYLDYLVRRLGEQRFEIITPPEPEGRGCQLSLRVRRDARQLLEALAHHGVVGDFREPDVIRVAPVPFYNTFYEVWRVGRILEEL